MKQLIDKDALVAEIERLQSFFVNERDDFEKGYHHSLRLFKSFLDTLEVKEVVALDDACKWWEEELSYPTMTADEINWYKEKVNSFRKAMKNETE